MMLLDTNALIILLFGEVTDATASVANVQNLTLITTDDKIYRHQNDYGIRVIK